MTFGLKTRHGLLGIGHKIRTLRHNNVLGQKLGNDLNVGGRIISNAARTGSMVAGIAAMAMPGTPMGAGLMAASKGLAAGSIIAGEVSKGGGRIEKKSTRLIEKEKRNDLENSNENSNYSNKLFSL